MAVQVSGHVHDTDGDRVFRFSGNSQIFTLLEKKATYFSVTSLLFFKLCNILTLAAGRRYEMFTKEKLTISCLFDFDFL